MTFWAKEIFSCAKDEWLKGEVCRGVQVKKERSSHGGVSLLLPGPCLVPWGSPTLPRSSTRAVSSCPSNAAAGPVSSSPQPCHAWLGVPQSQACPCSHILAWNFPIPIPRKCLMPLTALLFPVPWPPPAPVVMWWLFLLFPEEYMLRGSESSILGFSFGGRGRRLSQYLGTDSWLWWQWLWLCCLLCLQASWLYYS